VYAFERAAGKEAWSFLTGNRVDSSPVIAGQRVYVGSFDQHLYVLDLATGKELQKIRLDGQIIASPAVANGRLVVGTDKGTVYCLGAK
jgi:outer membrane protein assembly factor BamB